MELLLSAVKDTAATGRGGGSGRELQDVEQLIDNIGALSPPSRHRPSPRAAPPESAGAAAIESTRRRLEEDNLKLKSELLAARRLLSERLVF